MSGIDLGYPIWVRLTHWFNFLFMTMSARSGLAILAAHPKLYWNVHCRPGSEWLRLTRKRMPADRLWCSTDEAVAWPGAVALPGGHGLGLGRYWHYCSAMGWLLTGGLYVSLLFLSPQWRRLVPTSWEVFPLAARDAFLYATFHTPPEGAPYGPTPFNPLQQLTYFGVVFGLAPLIVLTGVAQSATVAGHFPLYERVFGSRQGARSLHFLGLLAFVGFLIGHVVMVVWHGFARETNKMVFGDHPGHAWWLGAAVVLTIIAAVVLLNVGANHVSRVAKTTTHRVLAAILAPPRDFLLRRLKSTQHYAPADVSPFFRTNGYPPVAAYPWSQGGDETYERLLDGHFADYRLEVGGLVGRPLSLSLAELRDLPRQDQTTMHHCIQGWTSIGTWSGVPVREILDRCQPLPGARFVLFHSFGFLQDEESPPNCTGHRYYEGIRLDEAYYPQTILAYELNGVTLPVQHGAPLRLRLETKLGFKMVKFVHRVELVADFREVGGGFGGCREDVQQFDMEAIL